MNTIEPMRQPKVDEDIVYAAALSQEQRVNPRDTRCYALQGGDVQNTGCARSLCAFRSTEIRYAIVLRLAN